jgi:L-ascorbate metabolism protein UlaG (beta-lactamase superfamily)
MKKKTPPTRRSFLHYLFLSIFVLLLPRCSKSQEHVSQEKLPYHHLPDGTFRNLPGAPKRLTTEERKERGFSPFRSFFLKRIFGRKEKIIIPEKYQIEEKAALADWRKTQNKEIALTFLGHASFLIRIGKTTILTDPFLSERAGVGFVGAKRFHAAGIQVKNLPPVDILFLSHNHYDHFDAPSLKKIKNKKTIPAIVPLKLGEELRDMGYENVQELDWFQRVEINGLRLTFLPAAHWSRRFGQDYNATLWGGLLIETGSKVIYFSGDTAYSKKIFEMLAEKIPTPDIAILPIGAYEPRWFMKASHTTPEEAVQIGVHLRAKNLVGMHWGSVVLSAEDVWEPPQKMQKAALSSGYKQEQIWVMANGETRAL